MSQTSKAADKSVERDSIEETGFPTIQDTSISGQLLDDKQSPVVKLPSFKDQSPAAIALPNAADPEPQHPSAVADLDHNKLQSAEDGNLATASQPLGAVHDSAIAEELEQRFIQLHIETKEHNIKSDEEELSKMTNDEQLNLQLAQLGLNSNGCEDSFEVSPRDSQPASFKAADLRTETVAARGIPSRYLRPLYRREEYPASVSAFGASSILPHTARQSSPEASNGGSARSEPTSTQPTISINNPYYTETQYNIGVSTSFANAQAQVVRDLQTARDTCVRWADVMPEEQFKALLRKNAKSLKQVSQNYQWLLEFLSNGKLGWDLSLMSQFDITEAVNAARLSIQKLERLVAYTGCSSLRAQVIAPAQKVLHILTAIEQGQAKRDHVENRPKKQAKGAYRGASSSKMDDEDFDPEAELSAAFAADGGSSGTT